MRLGIVILIAVVAFAAGGALRLSTDERGAPARKGAATVREDRGSPLPRLAGADPGPLPRPRRPSPTPTSTTPLPAAPAPALAAPPASPPPPTSPPQGSPAPRDGSRFGSVEEEGTGYFESER